MADAGILILAIIFAVLIIVIIRSCLIKLRDNIQHVKHHRTTRYPPESPEKQDNVLSMLNSTGHNQVPERSINFSSRRSSGRRRESEKSATEIRHDSDQQRQQWRLRDAEKRRKLEAEVQKISHLFQDTASEDDFEVVEFTLPGRRARLESSSTDREAQIRVKSAPPRRPPRRKTRRHREKHQGSKGNTAVALYKTPGWIKLQGPLAHTTDNIIYWMIRSELRYYQNKHPTHNIRMYLDKKFELSRKDDMAVMSLIQGINAIWFSTGDTQQAMTRSKQLQHDIHSYNLKYPAIAESQVYWNMCAYYMNKGKSGKAHSSMQAAASCIQHQSPSAWTSQGCALQGDMYDRLAHVRPGHRSKYQDLAVRCYTNAREHCLYQPCQEEEDYLYYPLLYTLHTVFIKLDMPIIYTIEDFTDSDIVYQRLSQHVVSVCQVTEAENLVTAVTTNLASLTARRRAVVNERILICQIIVNIRLTQLAISDQENHSALSFITTAQDLYDVWCDHASRYTDARFKTIPHLPRDIMKTVDTLCDCLIMTSHPDPQPEPLSDSLSSEPSDAPPSGLKQLTEESRRAEKQARRDAHQFSYSSGDVYTNSEVDMPSDVN